MKEKEIRDSIEMTEEVIGGFTVITLTSNGEFAKGRYDNSKWSTGFYRSKNRRGKEVKGTIPLEEHRKNLIEGLTKVLIDKVLSSNAGQEEEETEDFGI